MTSPARGGLFLLLLVWPGVAGAVCPPDKVAALETAFQAAPMADTSADEPAQPAVQLEHRCGADQARVVRQVLQSCQPDASQAVLLLGAGRCLQQAGLPHEGAERLRQYLRLSPGDHTVSAERGRERRERARRWLVEMGEADPGNATLLLDSTLRGPLVRHLEGYPDGVRIPAGETRFMQPPGPRRLSLDLPGFRRIDLDVDLLDDSETRAAVDWRRALDPHFADVALRWDDFVRSGLTPEGYKERRRMPISAAINALVLGAGAVLIGVCAANANNACDATWKEGVAYAAGGVLGLTGLVGLLAVVLTPPERLPVPTLPGPPR